MVSFALILTAILNLQRVRWVFGIRAVGGGGAAALHQNASDAAEDAIRNANTSRCHLVDADFVQDCKGDAF